MDVRPNLEGGFEVRQTADGAVVVRRGEHWLPQPAELAEQAAAAAAVAAAAGDEAAAGAAAGAGGDGKARGREQERLTKATDGRIVSSGKVGGTFAEEPKPQFAAAREARFERLWAQYEEKLAELPEQEISVKLPDGNVKTGIAFKTTPLDIALGISKSLAKQACVAVVIYTNRLPLPASLQHGRVVAADDEEADDADNLLDEAAVAEDARLAMEGLKKEQWDMSRPLEGDCQLSIKTFKDDEGKATFWHSSAHVLGLAMEQHVGAKLCMGPPTARGFYYDAFTGERTLHEQDDAAVTAIAQAAIKAKHPFQRLVISRQDALEMFADNPFKQQILEAKVPEGASTTVYRCGPLVDLCTGPHIPTTGRLQAFEVLRRTGSYWLGDSNNDSLQRMAAVAFPDKKLMKQFKKRMAEAKLRDHRLIGTQQQLFFFHELSPGSCFFLPHGANIYKKLMGFMRDQYRIRGFNEVVTPNIFNLELWRKSGHAQHYQEHMFTFEVEKELFGMKPMNCPGHCLLFGHTARNYKELPMRVADFGVLHRNEFSGALTGLTRVRRFQQDDAHIFCREDQIEDEVRGALEFMASVYSTFGFEFDLDLSTKPAKALGDPDLWELAEAKMKEALDAFGRPWRINPGDGAFYGPKIDIKVYDALGRRHQCATIQLDFVLPRRFGLHYADAAGERQVPVIVHRAILGSVERMFAVLTEHYAGNWPFWLSPRQVMVIPVSPENNDYARDVQRRMWARGFDCDVEDSSKRFPKKIREAQLAKYNFQLVVGGEEQANDTVNVRYRDNSRHGVVKVDDMVRLLERLAGEHLLDDAAKKVLEEAAPTVAGGAAAAGGGKKAADALE